MSFTLHRLKKKVKGLISRAFNTKVQQVEKPLTKKQMEYQIQRERVIPWFSDKGDHTLRMDYELDQASLVFDLGGYKGEFAASIFERYQPVMYIFEPIKKYYDAICGRFHNNEKVNIYHFGLAGTNGQAQISMSDDASSVFISDEDSETIELKSIVDFIDQQNIEKVDLIKINIEGGEYEVLESLISAGMINRFDNIQVQFHDFIIDNARERMNSIQNKLAETHFLTYQYEFVWENWKLK